MITKIQNSAIGFSANIQLAQSVKREVGNRLDDTRFKNQVTGCTKFDTFKVGKNLKGDTLVVEGVKGKARTVKNCSIGELKATIQKMM